MLIRSTTINKVIDGVEGLRLIAQVSSSHGLSTRSPTASSTSYKINVVDGPSCSHSTEDLESSSPTFFSFRHSTHSDLKSRALKTTCRKPAASKALRDRETRIREIKQRALKIPSTGNTPATEQQRLVMLMVFNEITPYPDEAWLSLVAVLIDREYHQVKNWFSNQRQKKSRANRENSYHSFPTTLASSLRKVTCHGRILRLRPSALKCCTAEEWSDQFFEEVVMVHNVKILMKLRRLEAELAMATEED